MSSSTNNLLDYIRSIVDKVPVELDNNYSQYALNMYFSKWKNCIHYIDVIDNLPLTNKQHYIYLMRVIPRGWQKKLEYPKTKKQEDIDIISKHYKVNEKIAKEYLIVMDIDELKLLREMYQDV